MRYDAEHKNRTRLRVLDEAANAIREDGPHRLGVASVMARAGLTQGGFYAHFASKEAFLAEAITHMFEVGPTARLEKMKGQGPREAVGDYIDFYLSARHRDTRTNGCPLPFLAGDVPRLSQEARERYAEAAAHVTTVLAEQLARLGGEIGEDEASSVLSEMVGAVTLARAEQDPARSEAILERSRVRIRQRLGLEAVQ